MLPRRTQLVDAIGRGPAFTDDGEILSTATERERNVLVAHSFNSVAATTWAVIVDLSDTENWPHVNTGRVDISYIAMQVDRSSTAVGRFNLGIVTRIDATSADVQFLPGLMFEKGDAASLTRVENFSPSQLKCGVVGGATPLLRTSSNVLNEVALQSDTAIAAAGGGTVIPAVGDIVARALHGGGGQYNASVSVLYHAEDHA